MNATPRMDIGRFLAVQRRLFDSAHAEPIELKAFGIALEREGRRSDRRYCSQSFLLLPFDDCERLSTLAPEQLNALTAAYFANNYARVATAEVIAIEHNIRTSETVFKPHSDDYQVLFNETAEEYDHIVCFHAVHRALLGAGTPRPFDGSAFPEFGFLRDFIERARGGLCPEGAGAAYLLLRYMANVSVKQTESFMHRGDDAREIHPLAVGITEGHASDEARHFSTSLEVGRRLFERATPSSREQVRTMLRFVLDSFVRDRFQPAPTHRGYYHRLAEEALALALAMPEFAGWPSIDDLRKTWRRASAKVEPSTLFQQSQQWAARAMQQLADAVEISPNVRGPAREAYAALL